MATPDLPQLEPASDDGIRAIQVGLGLWSVAGVVLLVQRDDLADDGTLWWLAVCGAGLLIGIITLGILVRRRSLIRARERERAALDDAGTQASRPTDTGPSDPRPTDAGPTG